MLRIVHDAANRAVDVGERGRRQQQQSECEQLEAGHDVIFPMFCRAESIEQALSVRSRPEARSKVGIFRA